jgi:hypothetical protein
MSTPLPPLHGQRLRATRAPARLLQGVPQLEDGALLRRSATGTTRVELVARDFGFRIRRRLGVPV